MAARHARCDCDEQHADDELYATNHRITEYADVPLIVKRDGTITNRWADGTVGVPAEIQAEAEQVDELFCPGCGEYIEGWYDENKPQLHRVVAGLRELGYPHPTVKSSGFISGSVYKNVDLTDAPRSVPEGENTGPFATLDNPEQHVPDDIHDLADKHGLEVRVMGHGGNSLSIYISPKDDGEDNE